jgi:hypothetical protein
VAGREKAGEARGSGASGSWGKGGGWRRRGRCRPHPGAGREWWLRGTCGTAGQVRLATCCPVRWGQKTEVTSLKPSGSGRRRPSWLQTALRPANLRKQCRRGLPAPAATRERGLATCRFTRVWALGPPALP